MILSERAQFSQVFRRLFFKRGAGAHARVND